MQKKNFVMLAAIAAGTVASLAQAGTLTGQYTGLYQRGVDVTLDSIHSGNISTVTFQWTRTDTPGPGVDSTISSPFRAYCIEINQTVSANTNYTFNVVSAATHGFTGMQEMLLGRLWASFQPLVVSQNTSAAFQMAVWELAFDSGADLNVGDFYATGPSGVKTLAQSWLNTISSSGYSGGQDPIMVLQHPNVQDQLVPAPGALALLGVGSVMVTRRKRA